MKKLTLNEQIFLIAIWHLRENAYGVRIREKIMSLTDSDIMFGTVYNTLEKLAKKGYVTAHKSRDGGDERGGHKKVFYSLTKEGMQALEKARSLQETLWSGISRNAFQEHEK